MSFCPWSTPITLCPPSLSCSARYGQPHQTTRCLSQLKTKRVHRCIPTAIWSPEQRNRTRRRKRIRLGCRVDTTQGKTQARYAFPFPRQHRDPALVKSTTDLGAYYPLFCWQNSDTHQFRNLSSQFSQHLGENFSTV